MSTSCWGIRSLVTQLTREVDRLGSTAARLKLKGIDGGPHKRWSMWFNSMIREEPYQGLNAPRQGVKALFLRTGCEVLHGCRQLVPWGVGLSPITSATPIVSCHHLVGDSNETAGVNQRKAGTTSNHHGSYILGDTRATMASTKGSNRVTWSKSIKTRLSSDWSLQLDSMKLESLVIAHQPWRGEYVLGSCTHRPSSHES